jgi:hypothetical protein
VAALSKRVAKNDSSSAMRLKSAANGLKKVQLSVCSRKVSLGSFSEAQSIFYSEKSRTSKHPCQSAGSADDPEKELAWAAGADYTARRNLRYHG